MHAMLLEFKVLYHYWWIHVEPFISVFFDYAYDFLLSVKSSPAIISHHEFNSTFTFSLKLLIDIVFCQNATWSFIICPNPFIYEVLQIWVVIIWFACCLNVKYHWSSCALYLINISTDESSINGLQNKTHNCM